MKTLNREQLKNMVDRKDDFLLIDVLPIDSYEKAHIPGAVNVPLEDGEFLEKVGELAGSKDKRIVTYCANFACTASTEAAKKLDAEGYKAVFDYKGGIKDWTDEGNQYEGRMRAAA